MRFVKIAIVHNLFEAQLLESILNEQDIPHLIQSYHDEAYAGLYQITKGWGAVHAPTEYRETIISILDELREQQVEIEEEDTP